MRAHVYNNGSVVIKYFDTFLATEHKRDVMNSFIRSVEFIIVAPQRLSDV